MKTFKKFSLAVFARVAVDKPSPALKHMPTVVAFAFAVVFAFAIPDIIITEPYSLWIGCMAMAIATGLSFYYSSLPRVTRWALVVPGFALLAIALLRFATGGAASVFSSLIILPVVWIAAEKGRRWVAVAIFGTSAALMLPYVLNLRWPDSQGEWLRGIFTPVIFGLAAAVINELSRQGRKQLSSIQQLAGQRELLLDEAIASAAAIRENETRLRQADRMTRSVLDAVTEQSVIGTDLTGLIDVWNPGAAAMLGLTPHETQGRRYISDFHLDDELEQRSRDLNYPPGETVLNPGFSALVESARLGTPEVREWTYVRDDGDRLSVSLAVTRRVDEDERTIGYIFVATDVTQALEVARLKDEFVGLISHELRTPLSSILGYLELMRDDEDDPLSAEHLNYLGVAERNAHRLLKLVGDLLFTAQVSSGKFPLDLADMSLTEVVSTAVRSAMPVASTAGVSLLLEASSADIRVSGDAVRLGQATDNLISNAVKFTPRGGSVTVAIHQVDDQVLVTVTDTGMGIPEAELDQLYARFFRASTATRNAVPGVGLGLTITKAIVTAHGGDLEAQSEVGVGTVFSMRLPVAEKIFSADVDFDRAHSTS